MSKHMRPDAGIASARNTVSERGKRRGHGKLVFALIMLFLILCLAFCGFLLVRSAHVVRAEAASAKESALVVAEAALAGDATKLDEAAGDLSACAHKIDRELSGVLWMAASHLPVLGADLTCARVAASAADDLCEGVLTPVVDEMAGVGLDDLIEGHTVNCEVLRRLDACVTEAAPVVHDAAMRLEALPRATFGEVRDAVAAIADPVYTLDETLTDNESLFSTLLAMLGDGGRRTYVLAALGNSELRAAGGMPGALGVIRVTDGAIELEDFASVHRLQTAVLEAGYTAPATEEELQTIGTAFVTDAAYVTCTPDFPRVGETTSAMWEAALGEHVDGVIAMDPVLLGRVLAVTGPVTAEDGTVVDSESCATELLSNVYWRYGYETNGNELEDAFFADVAHKSFDALFDSIKRGGAINAMRLVKVIADSGEDRRLQAWMEKENEQNLMSRLGLTGTVRDEGHETELGIYVNDYSWNKLCWYLNIFYDLERGPDTTDGRATFDVAVHFTNSITADEAARAPAYISQMYQELKRAPSDLVEEILIMAPAGGEITDYAVHPDAPIGADKTIPDERHELYGRDTWCSRINILGEGDTYVTFRLTMPKGATSTPRVVTSPLCHD